MNFTYLRLFTFYELMHNLQYQNIGMAEWRYDTGTYCGGWHDRIGTREWENVDLLLFLDNTGELCVWDLWIQLTLQSNQQTLFSLVNIPHLSMHLTSIKVAPS